MSDVLSRGVPVSWDEAVAVVDSLCELLLSQNDEPRVPDASSVLLLATGTVSVAPRAGGDREPTAAGHLLHDLLANSTNVPVALRLFVTQSTSSGTHGSLREFATALAYFGKPNPAELVRDLYHRAGVQAIDTFAHSPVPPPLNPPVPPLPQPEKARKRSRGRWLLAGVAVCGIVAAAWVGSHGGRRLPSASMGHDLLASLKSVFASVGEWAHGVADTTTASVSQEPPPARAPRARAPKPSAPKAVSATTSPQKSVGELSGTSAKVIPPSSDRPADAVIDNRQLPEVRTLASYLVTPSAVDESPDAGPPAVSDDAAPTGAVLYSSDDKDVRPPVLLNPKLPTPFFVGHGRPTVFNRMELIVAKDGTVERVQLVDGPTRMPDMMLLSGAKLWKFEPASKDGKPVRYRAFISWVAMP